MESRRGRQGTRPAAAAVLGILPAAELSPLAYQMHTSDRSVSLPCSNRVSATSRTAVYGPVCTVVWEGRSREAPPYPDLWPTTELARCFSSARNTSQGEHARPRQALLPTHAAEVPSQVASQAAWPLTARP